ncbi:MAG: hypothetical protein M0P69_13335 [Bacteroidales bacterium]|nr:hypothetical protein [Bacteroidales bacterium]
MTIEQEIQYALREAINAKLEAAELDIAVHAQKLDAIDDLESEQEYPVIVITTSTPVPEGHKSSNIDVPCWITVMTYLADDLKKDMFCKLCEIVFQATHGVDDWDDYMPENNAVEISAVVITAGEEPVIAGEEALEQTTNCTVYASYLHT